MPEMTFLQALEHRARLLAKFDAHLVRGDTPEKLASSALQILAVGLLMDCLEHLGLLRECALGTDGRRGDVSCAFGILITITLWQMLQREGIALAWKDEVMGFGEAFYVAIPEASARASRVQEGFRLAQQVLGNDATLNYCEDLSKLLLAYIYAPVKDVGIPQDRILPALVQHLETSFRAASVEGYT